MDATKTTTTAATTDVQANTNVATGEGVATDATQTQSQATNQGTYKTQATVDPKVAAALKALEDAGVTVYTDKQVNGREAALRRKMEADAQVAAQKAEQDAKDKALAEQGQFKPLYEQAQADIKARDERIQAMEPTLISFVEEATKGWPKVLLDKKPTDGGYPAMQAWFEAYRDIAAEWAKTGTQGKTQQYGQQLVGAGKSTQSTGNGHSEGALEKDARDSQSSLYRSW
jgi:hypothetical protein